MQGFGKVGGPAAEMYAEAGARVEAVSDEIGAVRRDGGLDLPRLREHVSRTGTVVGFDGGDPIGNDELLTMDVDVLVPAAVEHVLHTGNAGDVKARWVVEGANGPTTGDADAMLAERGVVVVPDILANAGGVVVSYFEWVQAQQAYWWTEAEIEQRLADRMAHAYDEVAGVARREGLSLRDAALLLSVHRVAEAHRIRGPVPLSRSGTAPPR